MTNPPEPCRWIEVEAAFQRLGEVPLVDYEHRAWVVRFRGEEIARNGDPGLAFGQARHWALEQANP